jgi:hypothetical protein
LKLHIREIKTMAQPQHLDSSQQLDNIVDKPKSSIADKPKSSFKGAKTGFEGREEDIGKAVQLALRTMASSAGYKHEMNDALVKARLHAMQFAKDMNIMEQYVEHDVKTMRPINSRVGQVIAKTGDKEAALVGLTERTACHYQLVMETEVEPGKRTWQSPWGNVLNACKRMGMFTITEKEIHEEWFTPRIKGFAADLGVEVKVSEWNDDGVVSIELAE